MRFIVGEKARTGVTEEAFQFSPHEIRAKSARVATKSRSFQFSPHEIHWVDGARTPGWYEYLSILSS